jgi:hypothetical protein
MEYVKETDQGIEKTIKGRPMEIEDKLPYMVLPEGKTLVGLSKGATVNLGNYQSARIDCWISSICDDNQESIQAKLDEISNIIDSNVLAEIQNIKD